MMKYQLLVLDIDGTTVDSGWIGAGTGAFSPKEEPRRILKTC